MGAKRIRSRKFQVRTANKNSFLKIPITRRSGGWRHLVFGSLEALTLAPSTFKPQEDIWKVGLAQLPGFGGGLKLNYWTNKDACPFFRRLYISSSLLVLWAIGKWFKQRLRSCPHFVWENYSLRTKRDEMTLISGNCVTKCDSRISSLGIHLIRDICHSWIRLIRKRPLHIVPFWGHKKLFI